MSRGPSCGTIRPLRSVRGSLSISAMIRTPEALIPYLLAAACIMSGGMWYAAGELASPNRIVTLDTPNVGGPFALVDQDGQTRTDRDFRGRCGAAAMQWTTRM